MTASQPPTDPPTGTAEDLKAAAALSNLSTTDENSIPKSDNNGADTAALGAALSNLKVSDANSSANADKDDATKKAAEAAAAAAKKVKIDAGDVAWLIDELEMTKAKATELLRANDGDKGAAVRSFVVPVSSKA